jgi:hypothetical protein
MTSPVGEVIHRWGGPISSCPDNPLHCLGAENRPGNLQGQVPLKSISPKRPFETMLDRNRVLSGGNVVTRRSFIRAQSEPENSSDKQNKAADLEVFHVILLSPD